MEELIADMDYKSNRMAEKFNLLRNRLIGIYDGEVDNLSEKQLDYISDILTAIRNITETLSDKINIRKTK